MATFMAALDSSVREELPVTLHEALPGEDQIYKNMVRTSQGVKRSQIGRGWKIMHRFGISISGLYEARPATGGVPYTTSAHSVVNYTRRSYPNPAQTPHASELVRTVNMNCHHGNFGVEIFDMKAESLESFVNVGKIARDLRKLGETIAQLECVSFYGNADKSLGVLAASGGSYTGTTHCTFTPTSTCIRWFKPGMLLDFYTDATGATKINVLTGTSTDVPIIVDNVDALAGTITVCSVAGTDISGTTIYNTGALDSQEAYIFPRGAVQTADGGSATVYRTGHYGLNDWIKESGTLFGDATAWNETGNDNTAAFSLTTYPEFKSKLRTLSVPLTEHALNEEVSSLEAAYSVSIDTMITTAKVVVNYINQPNLNTGRMIYERQGQALNIKGGWSKVSYDYEGRSIEVLISHYCQAGTLYGLILRNGNLKRYVPPRMKAVSGMGGGASGLGLGDEIEFVGPSLGMPGIFMPTTDATTGGVVPLAQCPFHQYSQVVPVDVRGLKISSITESN